MPTLAEEVISYEDGDMTADEEIRFFQGLINSGSCWHLQGHYGRTASDLIDAGYCVLGKEGFRDYWGNYVPSRYEVAPGTKGSVEYANRLREQRGEELLDVES